MSIYICLSLEQSTRQIDNIALFFDGLLYTIEEILMAPVFQHY